ncbi:MAG: NMD3-related protein [Candidatus Thermoplasmatota archaeon]
MFCVECGKDGLVYKNGYCLSCYIKHHRFTKGPFYLDVYMCPKCGMYKYRNTYLSESFDVYLNRVIKDVFMVSSEMRNVDFSVSYDRKDNTIVSDVVICGELEDVKVREQHQLTVRIKRETCVNCSRRYGGYYEAILQVRGDKRDSLGEDMKEIRKMVEDTVDDIRSRGGHGLFITEVVEIHGGLDFYISDKGSALMLAKRIYTLYGGEMKHSAKDAGMEDSRHVYRMTYLIRLSPYRRGDVIEFNGRFYYLSSVHESTVHLVDLLTWSRVSFNLRDLKKARIIGEEGMIEEMMLISQTSRDVQLMDQKTYRVINVDKPEGIMFKKGFIKVIKVDDKVLLIPDRKL